MAGREFPSPSPFASPVFAAFCLALSTIVRWGIARLPSGRILHAYFPAVFLAAAFGGFRIKISTAIAGGALGVSVNFSSARCRFRAVCAASDVLGGLRVRRSGALSITERSSRSSRKISEAPDPGRGVPQAAGRRVAAPARRTRHRRSTPCCIRCCRTSRRSGARIDNRIRALSATDDLIARLDGSGCDIKEMLHSNSGPTAHVSSI